MKVEWEVFWALTSCPSCKASGHSEHGWHHLYLHTQLHMLHMLVARKSVSEKNNLLILWCKVETWKSCFINTAVSCVYKTQVKIFRDKLRLHEICLHIFSYPKEQFLFYFIFFFFVIHAVMLFLSVPPLSFKNPQTKGWYSSDAFQVQEHFGGAVWEAAAVASNPYTVQYQLLRNRYKLRSVALSKG